MSFLSVLLKGAQIADVHCDSELTYLMLSNGTQVTIRGLLVVEPASSHVPRRLVPVVTPGSSVIDSNSREWRPGL